jgi:hypothetical protein
MKKYLVLLVILGLSVQIYTKNNKLTALSEIFVKNIPLMESMKENHISKELNVSFQKYSFSEFWNSLKLCWTSLETTQKVFMWSVKGKYQ